MNIHHIKGADDNSIENLFTCCVACHAVLHFGRHLALGLVEIWKCPLPQVEIVRQTRKGIREEKTLAKIKKSFDLTPGDYEPGSERYANNIIDRNSKLDEFILDEPFSVIFTSIKRWQV